MDLGSDYRKLYAHWLKEFQNPALTVFTDEVFAHYKQMIKSIKELKADNDDKIKSEIISTHKQNFTFLFDDLLKMRELKLKNFALTLQEVDLEHLNEAEKVFYQNIVSAIKGFEKLKALSLFDEALDVPTQQLDTEIETVNQNQIIDEDDARSLITSEDFSQDVSVPNSNSKADKKIEMVKDTIDYKYTLIRFLKKTPPLVGIDMISYGPFEEQDIANLPLKNAKILITEKFAELLMS